MNTETPARTSFIRICRNDYVKGLIKEAKRVKYIVNKNGNFNFEVLDPDFANALVFSGVQFQRGIWSVRFSKDYWQEPTV